MNRIFLSYARGDDEPFVKRLNVDLEKAGFSVWFDRDSLRSRGLTFLQEIKDAIRTEVDRVVFIGGPKAAISDYVRGEWQFALTCDNVVVTPILRIGTDDYSTIPGELSLLHCEDFRDDEKYSAALDKLITSLRQPNPKLGGLFAVPNLPANFLGRPELMRRVRDALLVDLQKPQIITRADACVGMQGMGGIGKSVLAAALARNRDIRQSYPDGVVWISFGQNLTDDDLIKRQRDLIRHLGGGIQFSSLAQGQGVLRELLAGKSVLIVLDDVWSAKDAKPFDVLGPRCRMLVTTRDDGILHALHGERVPVSLFTETEALQLLADAVDLAPKDLPSEAHEVVRECGLLPLALALSGGMAKKRGGDFRSVLERLRRADLEKIADRESINEQHRSIWRAMEASVEMLPANERERFAELAVFTTDQTIPEAAVATLWANTAGLDDLDTEELLINLAERSLILVDQTSDAGGMVRSRHRLHDLIHDYVGRIGGEVQALQQKLIHAYREKCPDGWHTCPDDGYFYQNISVHLQIAQEKQELINLGRSDAFLAAQAATSIEDPNLSNRTLLIALDAACSSVDPVAMAEITLKHASRLLRQGSETPLEVLVSSSFTPIVALKRAWELADVLEPQSRVVTMLLLLWKLKTLGRLDEARTLVKKIKEGPISKADDYNDLIVLLLALLEPDVDVTALAVDLLNGKALSSLASTLAQLHCIESAKRILSLDMKTSSRDHALSAVATAQIQAAQKTGLPPVDAIETAIHIKTPEYCATILQKIAVVTAELGLDPSPVFCQALAAAHRVKDHYWRASTLNKVAGAQAKAGQDARPAFCDALATTAQIDDLLYRAWALIKIAGTQAQAGQDAGATFDESLATAAQITDVRRRGLILMEIAEEQAKTGQFAQALGTAGTIDDSEHRSMAWSKIAGLQVQAGQAHEQALIEAWSAVAQLEPGNSAHALISIAEAQAKAGQDPETVFVKALNAAILSRRLPDGDPLDHLAEVQAKLGLFTQALTTAAKKKFPKDVLKIIAEAQVRQGHFNAAMDTAAQIKTKQGHVQVLAVIAMAQAMAGQSPGVVLEEACKTAARLDQKWHNYEPFVMIAEAQTRVGQNSSIMFANAIDAAKRNERDLCCALALSEIAKVQAKAGQDPTSTFCEALVSAGRAEDSKSYEFREISKDQARVGLISQAVVTASNIGDGKQRILALCGIAEAQAKAGQNAAPIIAEALAITKSLQNETFIDVLAIIAQEQVKVGQDPAATINNALVRISRITEPLSRALALSKVAWAQAQAGQDPGATFVEALATAARIENVRQNVWALTEIALVQARTGYDSATTFNEASARTARIENMRLRADAMRGIAEAYAKLGYLSQALATAAKIENVDELGWALGEIAEAQVQAGQFPQALTSASGIIDTWRRTVIYNLVAKAQVKANEILGAFVTVDMIHNNQASALNKVGSAMVRLADANSARAALYAYLSRAARYMDSAWSSYGVIALLYPEKSTELANALIATYVDRRGCST
jgi:tetratricopeptide (TPR) repeat protein